MGRKPKRMRTEAEVAALAARLGADWHPADAVATWLRRHARELGLIVRDDGWSWPDVARALTAAGIAYRTGRPWNAKVLRNKVSEAVKVARRDLPLPEQAEAVANALRGALSGLGGIQHVHIHIGGSPPPAATAPPPPAPTAKARKPRSAGGGSPDRPAPAAEVAREPAADPQTGEGDGPRFEPVSFADGWLPPPPQPEAPRETKPPKPRRRYDPDDVLRRLHGRDEPAGGTGEEEK